MSTRSQVIIKDDYNEIWFYRHSDGYPDGNMPVLCKFIEWVRDRKIRDNAKQSAGWLVLLGAIEYQTLPPELFGLLEKSYSDHMFPDLQKISSALSSYSPAGWKCGAYEPCEKVRHGNIEYIYVVNLTDKTVKGYETAFDDETGDNDRLVCADTPEKAWKSDKTP